MDRITKCIVGKTENDDKRNFIWNMFGSSIYSFVSVFLSVCVIQMMGAIEGGIFSIALTVSQMLLYIAYFEQRTYQITDVNFKYTFSQYHGAKLIACLLMMFISIGYVCLKAYPFHKKCVIFLMCVFRMLDGYADLYEGQFQLNGKIYLSGKSMTFRSLFSFIALIISLIISKSIIISIFSAIIASVISIIIFNINILRFYEKIEPTIDLRKVPEIMKACFPLFVGAFLWVYILSASRIAVDGNMSNEFMAYYQILFMPVSIVNLFATFFFRPSLTYLSELYNKNQIDLFRKKISGILLLILIFTIICMLGAYLLGIPILTMISGCDLISFRQSLVLLMLAGGLNSGAFFMYYILSIMRKTKHILVGYLSAAGISLMISNYLVKSFGIMGASLSFFLTVLYLFSFFMIGAFWHKISK